MKNLTKNLFLFLISVSFILTSCSKPEDLPRPDNENPIVDTYNIDWSLVTDRDWVLVGANFYYTDSPFYFEHPDTSVMNPYYGSSCDFDNFIIGETIWRFNDDNTFLLDGGLESTNSYYRNGYIDLSICGTRRPITSIIVDGNRLEVRCGDLGDKIGRPYNRLVFKRNGGPNVNITPTSPTNYTSNGTLPVLTSGTTPQTLDLVGTKWVVTKIYLGFGTDNPNDTLEFLSGDLYTINGIGNINRVYSVTPIVGNTSINLNLYDFNTVQGGNFSILVSRNFIGDYVINGSIMEDLLNTNNTNKLIWMNRIQ